MAGSELVMLTLRSTQKAGQATLLAQGVQPVVAPGQNLPGIALMPHVPDDLVARRLEPGAERDCQLDDAESGTDVATRLGDDVDEPLAHLVGQLLQLFRRERLDVCGTLHPFENQLGLVTM